MLTGIKLVQNTHCFLKCWYRTSLVFTRKTNANKNQSGRKIHTVSYNAGIEPLCYSREKQNNANRNQTGTKYTLLLTMLV